MLVARRAAIRSMDEALTTDQSEWRRSVGSRHCIDVICGYAREQKRVMHPNSAPPLNRLGVASAVRRYLMRIDCGLITGIWIYL